MRNVFLVGSVLGVVLFGFIFFENLSGGGNKSFVEINGARFLAKVARTSAEREKGLSGREHLGKNDGMLFIFEEPGLYGFWMKDMKFPIDIIWIKDGRIVGFSENVEPQISAQESELKIYKPPGLIDRALEINANGAKQHGIKIGDFVRF